VAALEARGIEPRIDMRDLPKLEDWQRELLGFIREADAVVFIVSPNSISSAVCVWEVEQVAKLNKRLAPIVLPRPHRPHRTQGNQAPQCLDRRPGRGAGRGDRARRRGCLAKLCCRCPAQAGDRARDEQARGSRPGSG
jgi:TIR domain